MRVTRLTIPQVGMIAATRGMLGAGIGILAGGRMKDRRRNRIGWALVMAGALTTVPLLLMALKHSENVAPPDESGTGDGPGHTPESRPREEGVRPERVGMSRTRPV